MDSRNSPHQGVTAFEEIRRLVAQGRLADAIDAFLAKSETHAPELRDSAIVLSGRLRTLDAEETRRTITRDEAEVERQRIAKALLDLLRTAQTPWKARLEASPFSPQERQARIRYLKTFRRNIENLLQESIHNARFLDLGIRDTRSAIYAPWMYQAPGSQSFSRIEDALSAYEGRLLVLGAPGAGKTTTLQHIALQLLDAAEKDESAPIPVLVNLSKFRMDASRPLYRRLIPWSALKGPPQQPSFEDWLAGELAANRAVTRPIALKWIQEDRIAALLDGLDEVSEEQRTDLVQLLNQTFLTDHPYTPAVISSRIDEYEPLRGREQTRLQLLGAVTLTPLSTDHILSYLAKARAQGLAQALEKDSSLMESARTPLTLSMMTLAYADLAEETIQADLSHTNRWYHLMESYVSRMLQRNERRARGIPFDANPDVNVPQRKYRYHPVQINRHLGWLAIRLSVRMQTAFSPDHFYSFLSRSPVGTQASADAWISTLTLALFSSAVFTIAAIPFLLAPGSALPATGILALGATLLIIRGTHSLIRLKTHGLIGSIWSLLTNLSIAVGIFASIATMARAVFTLLGLQPSPFAAATLTTGAVATICMWLVAALEDDQDIRSGGWWFLAIIGLSFLVAFARPSWLLPDLQPDVFPVTVLLAGQALWAAWLGRPRLNSIFAYLVMAATVLLSLAAVLSIALDWIASSVTWPLALSILVIPTSLLIPTNRDAAAPLLIISAGAMLGGLIAGPAGFVVAIGLLALFVLISALALNIDLPKLEGLSEFADKGALSPILLVLLKLTRSLPIAVIPFLRYCGNALLLKPNKREVEFVHRRLRDHFALRDLIPRLQATDRSVRISAIQAMGYQGVSAVAALAELTTDPGEDIRAAAVSALGHIAAPEAVSLLNQAMKDAAPEVRLAATLGSFNIPTEAHKQLLLIAAADSHPAVQFAAVNVAAKALERVNALEIIALVLRTRNDREALRQIIPAIMSGNSPDEHELTFLAHILPASGGEALRGLVDNTEERSLTSSQSRHNPIILRLVRWFLGLVIAKDALERSIQPGTVDLIRHGAMSLIAARLEFADIEHSIRRLKLDSRHEIRALACRVLTQLYGAAGADEAGPMARAASKNMQSIADALIQAISDRSTRVCAEAIRCVARLRLPGAIEPIRRLTKIDSLVVRHAAAQAIGDLGTSLDVPVLHRFLGELDDGIRMAAATALGKIGHPSSVKPLVKALVDRSPKMRESVVTALGRLGGSVATDALRKALHDRSGDVRVAATTALLSANTPVSKDILFELAKHPLMDVRLTLINNLETAPLNEQAKEVLELLLHDSHSAVRSLARAALGQDRTP